MAFNVSNDYKRIIYSQDDDNDIKIWFNNVELANAGYLTEKLEGTFRLLANDGKKRFSLDNFVAKELTLTIHDVNLNAIQDQVQISIGTLVNNQYEYVPIGIFNIQDTPTTNNGTTTIKLRDNRVKFEFEYNAKPLIDAQFILTTDTTYLSGERYYSYNSQDEEYVLLELGTDYNVGDTISGTVYEEKGTITYKQMLDDICQKAGVVNKVTTFDGDDKETSFFDNSLKGNIYVTYIAEQGGYVPIIDREGALDFVDLNNAYVWRIPLSIVSDNYQIGTPYNVQRVVYESGIIKYETSNDETLNTLYLDASNPLIVNQQQVEDILTKFANFEIDSVLFSNAILGNPAIDPYDIIEVYDDEDENEAVIFRTLANHTYTFNGKHRQLFDTQIDKEARKENVSKNNENTFKRWATTSINNLDAEIQITAGEVTDAKRDISTLNINSSSINSKVEGLKSGYFDYYLTSDATYQQGKTYYELVNGEYVVKSGYNVGDTIPADTIYEANWIFGASSVTETLNNLSATIQEQSNDAITTWFNTPMDVTDPQSPSLSSMISELSSDNADNVETLRMYRSYIRDSYYTGYLLTTDISVQSGKQYYTRNGNTYTPVSNPTNANIKSYYEYFTNIPYIELGSENSPSKLRIMPNRIQFYTNNEETAYISNNSLYISESTILTKQQIGSWVTVEDANHNLNTYWSD